MAASPAPVFKALFDAVILAMSRSHCFPGRLSLSLGAAGRTRRALADTCHRHYGAPAEKVSAADMFTADFFGRRAGILKPPPVEP